MIARNAPIVNRTDLRSLLDRRLAELSGKIPGLHRDGKYLEAPCPKCGGNDRFFAGVVTGYNLFTCHNCGHRQNYGAAWTVEPTPAVKPWQPTTAEPGRVEAIRDIYGNLAAFAQAQLAYTAKDVFLRAGPARDYPVIVVLPRGLAITVQGCLNDYSWCDVIAGPDRGWFYAGNINYAYQGGYAPVLTLGAAIGIGVTAFILSGLDRQRAFWNETCEGLRHQG